MNKQQLANKIWESANKMRSKIEANEYKDYILGFIFYINEFGKFDTLKATVDTEKTKTFLEMMEGKPIKKFQINMKIDQMLRRFILEGGFDVE